MTIAAKPPVYGGCDLLSRSVLCCVECRLDILPKVLFPICWLALVTALNGSVMRFYNSHDVYLRLRLKRVIRIQPLYESRYGNATIRSL